MDITDNHEWLYVALPYIMREPFHVERLFWHAFCHYSGSPVWPLDRSGFPFRQ